MVHFRRRTARVQECAFVPTVIAAASCVSCLYGWTGTWLAAAVTEGTTACSRSPAVRPRDMYPLCCVCLPSTDEALSLVHFSSRILYFSANYYQPFCLDKTPTWPSTDHYKSLYRLNAHSFPFTISDRGWMRGPSHKGVVWWRSLSFTITISTIHLFLCPCVQDYCPIPFKHFLSLILFPLFFVERFTQQNLTSVPHVLCLLTKQK